MHVNVYILPDGLLSIGWPNTDSCVTLSRQGIPDNKASFPSLALDGLRLRVGGLCLIINIALLVQRFRWENQAQSEKNRTVDTDQ